VSRLQLHWRILIALVAAVVVGISIDTASGWGRWLAEGLDFVGRLFLRALRMLVVPLIAASIVSSLAARGGTQGLGRLGLKTAAYYLMTSVAAILIGLAAVNLVSPGRAADGPASGRLGLEADRAQVAERVGHRSLRDVAEVVVRMVPSNVLRDAADDQMLGVIFFSLLFGYFLGKLRDRQHAALAGFWDGVHAVMLLITEWVMRFAPLGVFALVARVVQQSGLGVLWPLMKFVVTVAVALSVHAVIVLPLAVRLLGRVSPLRHLRAMAPALLMAFSTASSSATLPLTLKQVQQRAGVSDRVSSFTLPLGATINMDGTALYECVAAVFIAQAYGIDLGFLGQFTVVFVALVTSIGVAGIPAASLVAITLILTVVGLPLEGVGLILAVDRILDMCRTAVNVFSDSCAAVVIARTEGERGILSQPVESATR
jgi:Na+/H+-dicarboxylate symporter